MTTSEERATVVVQLCLTSVPLSLTWLTFASALPPPVVARAVSRLVASGSAVFVPGQGFAAPAELPGFI